MPSKDELGNACDRIVRLHFKSIGTPSVPEFTALRNMQRIYGPNRIKVEMASGESLWLESGQRLALANVDSGTCTMGSVSGEQSTLYSLGSMAAVGSRDILVYYVDALTMTNGHALAGCASHPTGRPACAVAALGSPWTLAHEVGHVLGLSHVNDATNVMHTPTASITANPPGFTAAQLTTIRSSNLCAPC